MIVPRTTRDAILAKLRRKVDERLPIMIASAGSGLVAKLLEQVRLRHLTDELHGVRMWHEELSPGEQQRVSLARILLHRPTLLVLDEATSALDADNARHFYDSVRRDLPDITIISVLHDEALVAHHSHMLTFADGRARPAKIQKDTNID